MQQLQELRGLPHRLGDRRQWFQVGMASATILTPLVSRWRSLRAAERARALWEASQISARWPWNHSVSEESLPPLARREVRTGLWLAGVGVGLAAAGTAAFIIARRRWHAEEEPLDLPLITRASANGSLDATGAASSDRGHVIGDGSTLANGSAQTLASAGPASNGAGTEPGALLGGVGAPLEPPEPLFIGNTRTLQYAAADADDAPPEEMRIYFASEAQARQAGYHPASGAPPQPRE